jgi:hypothetical protein
MIMPKLSKHSKDDVYKSIMGENTLTEIENKTDKTDIETQADITAKQVAKMNPSSKTKKVESDLDELVHKSYYITKRHVKALKIRTAHSDKPEEKDFSAIVRAALDLYLADTLKDI